MDQIVDVTPYGGIKVLNIGPSLFRSITAYDAQSGELLWSLDFGTGLSAGPYPGGIEIVMADDVLVFDAQTPDGTGDGLRDWIAVTTDAKTATGPAGLSVGQRVFRTWLIDGQTGHREPGRTLELGDYPPPFPPIVPMADFTGDGLADLAWLERDDSSIDLVAGALQDDTGDWRRSLGSVADASIARFPHWNLDAGDLRVVSFDENPRMWVFDLDGALRWERVVTDATDHLDWLSTRESLSAVAFAGDIDSDDVADVTTVDIDDEGITLGAFSGATEAILWGPRRFEVEQGGVVFANLGFGDLSGDGVLDSVLARGTTGPEGEFSVLLGDGIDGANGLTLWSVSLPPSEVSLPYRLRGDLNGNGTEDFAIIEEPPAYGIGIAPVTFHLFEGADASTQWDATTLIDTDGTTYLRASTHDFVDDGLGDLYVWAVEHVEDPQAITSTFGVWTPIGKRWSITYG